MAAIQAMYLAGLLALASVCAGQPKAPPPSAARKLFLTRCSACHDPSRVNHRVADRDEWREIVDRMRGMPQSGISPEEADTILEYLVNKHGQAKKRRLGGRASYGEEWLSILEVRTVRDGRVTLGGREYSVEGSGRSVDVGRGRERFKLALSRDGTVRRTRRVDAWKIGKVRYEVHLVLYEVRGESVRLGRALRRRS